jgi:hypothetical protein
MQSRCNMAGLGVKLAFETVLWKEQNLRSL